MAGLNLFTNNAATTLASGLSNVATSLTVSSGTGAEFPTLAGSEYFYCTLANNAGSIEIVKVTARSTDTFTIVRAQDGTSAAAWSAGDKVELRLNRIDLLNFPQLDSTNTFALAQTFTAAPVFTDQSGTRTAMLAAKSGANSDITSLTACTTITGLTTPLSVAQGGTGAATLTANNVILGNGTSAVAFVAPGTTGNLLTSNGTTWTSAAAPVSGFTNMQVFTSPGPFTTPSTTTRIKVTVVGGGASGNPGTTQAGGGGGGGSAIYVGPVTASTPYSVTVGAVQSTAGTAGNTSSFAALASATGGAIGPTAGPTSGRGGLGGAGSAGTLQFNGSSGSPVNSPGLGGGGGGSFLGGSTQSQTTAPGSSNGVNYGGGGSGSGSGTPGTGAAGVVVVEY
jgi:hypothetical protein